MTRFTYSLKILALITIGVGLFHATLSLSAESLLGANLPDSVINDPVLDSQNRFYGMIFACYGVLVFLAATDLHKYLTLFRIQVGFLFLGGLIRLVSIAQVGLPSGPIIFLVGLELLLPPMLIWWHRSIAKQSYPFIPELNNRATMTTENTYMDKYGAAPSVTYFETLVVVDHLTGEIITGGL